MNKQELRESAQQMVGEISAVLIEAVRTGAEQTRLELAQVRAEMRDDALTEALERLGQRRQAIEHKLARTNSGAVRKARERVEKRDARPAARDVAVRDQADHLTSPQREQQLFEGRRAGRQ